MLDFLASGQMNCTAEFFWKTQRKTWYSILGQDAIPLSLKNLLLRYYIVLSSKCVYESLTKGLSG